MKVTLKRSDVRMLLAVMSALDGRRVPIYDKDKNLVEVITQPYKFGVGVRYALAKTARKIQDEVDSIEKEIKQQRAAQNGDAEAVDAALLAFVSEEVDVEIHQIKEDDLNADENQLPSTVLRWLLPMLEECGDDVKLEE